MPHLRVPFMDLSAQHGDLEAELIEAVVPLLQTASFVGGSPVARFEEAFAQVHDLPHAVSVKSGTAAIQLALEALGVRPGDEVLVPAFTFIATAASVVRAGATPVFVDVDPRTACMDPQAAARAISAKTRVLMPVHLYGHPAAMDALMALAREHDLKVLEDCAQSHLATWNGHLTGTLGDAGAFSFYPSKNLGAAGDAGAVITRNPELADRIRRLANHGRTDRYNHAYLGWNERLDAIQAAVLTVKLRHLPAWTERRRELAARYRAELAGVKPFGKPLVLPVEEPGCVPVYHLFATRHPERDRLAEALSAKGVDTAVHYPTTLPQQQAFQELGLGAGSYPVAEAWARDGLSLPFFPEMTDEQQDRVIAAVQSL